MSTVDSPAYSEATEQARPRQVKLSHLSVEVGHFYMEDMVNGVDLIRAQFRQVAIHLAELIRSLSVEPGMARPRVSTCFLVDDYFRDDTRPADIIGKVTGIAAECGVTIDYLAREGGCVAADGTSLAEITAGMLLSEPPAGTTGSRPPLHETGWLCNGERSADVDAEGDQAMRLRKWQPPVEFGKRNHSIFVDIELWKDIREQGADGIATIRRLWSCPFLASVWQLIRLGLLRSDGEPVAVAQPWPKGAEWPSRWGDLPAVIQLNPRAAPFAAYWTASILPRSYLAIEHAVDVILGHLDLDPAVVDQTVDRAEREGIALSPVISERLSHIFIKDMHKAIHVDPR